METFGSFSFLRSSLSTDEADAPPAREWPAVDGWSIGEPDLVLKMREPFFVPDELLDDLRHQGLDLICLRRVGLDGHRLDAQVAQVRDHVLGRFGRAGVGDGDVRALLGQAPCDGGADAAAAAGDQGHLAFECLRHFGSPR